MSSTSTPKKKEPRKIWFKEWRNRNFYLLRNSCGWTFRVLRLWCTQRTLSLRWHKDDGYNEISFSIAWVSKTFEGDLRATQRSKQS